MTGTTHKKRYKVQRLTYKSPPPPRVLSLPTSGRAALKADGPCATPPIVQNAAEKVKPSFWQSRPDKENNMLKEGIQHPLSDLSANLSFLHDRSPPLEEKKKQKYQYTSIALSHRWILEAMPLERAEKTRQQALASLLRLSFFFYRDPPSINTPFSAHL